MCLDWCACVHVYTGVRVYTGVSACACACVGVCLDWCAFVRACVHVC